MSAKLSPDMRVTVTNAQTEARVDLQRMARFASRAAVRLKLCAPGTLSITFIGTQQMRRLNRRFCRHDWATDVLSFRYDGESTVGEIFIAPAQARAYARAHRIPYAHELSRYVAHGLLHWLGHQDRSAAQQQKMRRMEDRLLETCGSEEPGLSDGDTHH